MRKLKGKRLARVALTGGVIATSLLGMAANALADITWQNNQTNGCLEWSKTGSNGSNDIYTVRTGKDTIPWPSSSCGGTGFVDSKYSNTWVDPIAVGGTGIRVEQPSINGAVQTDSISGRQYCLDSNNQWSSYGSVYLIPCNGGQWQEWNEVHTGTGWALQDVHTGLWLDGGNGPNYSGQFASQNLFTNGNYGNTFQRWR